MMASASLSGVNVVSGKPVLEEASLGAVALLWLVDSVPVLGAVSVGVAGVAVSVGFETTCDAWLYPGLESPVLTCIVGSVGSGGAEVFALAVWPTASCPNSIEGGSATGASRSPPNDGSSGPPAVLFIEGAANGGGESWRPDSSGRCVGSVADSL